MDTSLAALSSAVSSSAGLLAACSLRVRAGDSFIRLMPAGEFTAPRGALAGAGPWHLTPQAAQRLIAANSSRQAEILIDFEHQTLLAAENGKPVPAAGWVDPRSLEFRADGDEPGLYGRVTWAGDTAALIAADQYRYLSPVFTYDAHTGEPLDLLHVGLTNFPAIDAPLVAALSRAHPPVTARGGAPSAPTPEDPMNELLKKLLAKLGLSEDASEDDALAALAKLQDSATQAEAATAEVAALKAATPDPTQYVPLAVFEAERAERMKLAALTAQGDVTRMIDEAIADGRLLEPQRAYAEQLGKTDLAALKGLIDSAAPIAALKGLQTQGQPPAGAGGDTAPDAAALAVCRALGLSPEEYAKGKLTTEGR